MKTTLMVILAIISVIIIISVLLQSSKSDGLSGSIGGGAEQLFGKKKSRGYDGLLNKITVVCSVAFFVLSLVILKVFS